MLRNTRATGLAAGLSVGLMAVLSLSACGTAAVGGAAGTAGAGTVAVADASFPGLSAQQVLNQARTALEGVDSVRLTGTTDALSIPIISGPASMDITIVNGKGATGTVKVGSGALKVLMVGSSTYSQPDAALLSDLGPMGASMSNLLAGRWMEASASELSGLTGSDGGVDPLSYTSTFSALQQGITAGSKLTRVPGKTVDGHETTGIRFTIASSGASSGASSAGTGTVYVAISGKPYPLLIERTGTSIALSHWGEQVAIRKPAKSEIVDMSQLGLGSVLGGDTSS